MGGHFVSSLICTLKSKKNLGFSSPAIETGVAEWNHEPIQ